MTERDDWMDQQADTWAAEHGEPPRTPPHDLEAERALLGCLLLSPNARTAVAGHVHPDDHHSPNHRAIHHAILELDRASHVDTHGHIDLIVLRDHLDTTGHHIDPQDLVGLLLSPPSIGGATQYARIVRQHALRRRIIDAAHRTLTNTYNHLPVDDLEQLARQADHVADAPERHRNHAPATTDQAVQSEFRTPRPVREVDTPTQLEDPRTSTRSPGVVVHLDRSEMNANERSADGAFPAGPRKAEARR